MVFKNVIIKKLIKTQILGFADQVCRLEPQISAAGYFKVGKKIFPTVGYIIYLRKYDN